MFLIFVDNWAWDDDDGDGDDKAPPVVDSSKIKSGGGKEKDAEGWTKECIIALSPMADVLVIAKDERAVILTCMLFYQCTEEIEAMVCKNLGQWFLTNHSCFYR